MDGLLNTKAENMTRTLDPKSVPVNWTSLLQAAIGMAAITSDPRLGVLEKARREGKAETTLRRFGILSEADLLREFPEARVLSWAN